MQKSTCVSPQLDHFLIAEFFSVYDGQGNIVRSIDIKALKEYNYQCEDGKMIRATECNITLNANEIVTTKAVVNAIRYYYGTEDKMTRKVISPASGSEQTIYYENGEDNTVIKFTAGGRTITSHSKPDSFGRKVFDEIQTGSGFISRQFSYHAGQVTDEHKQNGKLKSSPTTSLVSQITLSDGRAISYEYDAEERITRVTDSIDGITEYTYDALGQLLTETVNDTVVNAMTYDNYGNILTKNGVTYTYDTVWKDKLLAVGNEAISYDAQGNPTSYLGHALTWEKGRQLSTFDSNTYTYNAMGVRTSKIVGTVRHTFTLDGAKIVKETWGNNTLTPFYNNEDSVCGIIFNGTAYYFLKNLQGDIIAITNAEGETVARYTYDALGKCTITQDTTVVGIATVNPFRYRGYYLDTETGLYYLNSRYYDPETARFLNSDSPEYVSITGGNLYAYCNNTPTGNADYMGFCSAPSVPGDSNKSNPFLAIGLQLAVSYGSGTVGLEALWSMKTGKFYLFAFFGGNASFGPYSMQQAEGALIEDLLLNLNHVPVFSVSSLTRLGKWEIAISFIAVIGNKYAKFPKNYSGWFTCYAISFMHITGSAAYSKSGSIVIGSVGLGVTTSKASLGCSQTYYVQITGSDAVANNLEALKNSINDKIATLKLLAMIF